MPNWANELFEDNTAIDRTSCPSDTRGFIVMFAGVTGELQDLNRL
jgi:hypothetical protein